MRLASYGADAYPKLLGKDAIRQNSKVYDQFLKHFIGPFYLVPGHVSR